MNNYRLRRNLSWALGLTLATAVTSPAIAQDDEEMTPREAFRAMREQQAAQQRLEEAEGVAPDADADSLPPTPPLPPPEAIEAVEGIAGGEFPGLPGGQQDDDDETPVSNARSGGTPVSRTAGSVRAVFAPDNDNTVTPMTAHDLRFNFQGASLDTILDYFSRAAGFIVVKEAEVEGTIDMISHQPMNSEQAVGLLNTALKRKGYAAVRNGRVLSVVPLEEARTRTLPVRAGNVPDAIPSSDEMVTQIIPVRYANAEEMINDLQALLPDYATISANKTSNAVVLTDSQNNIRRVVEIIQALDQSISEISEIQVFQVRYGDAKKIAELITNMFTQQTQTTGGDDRAREFFRRFGRGGRGDDNNNNAATSAAQQAASRVTAAADERTNAVIVSAPEALMPTIADVIESIDRSIETLSVVRVFKLNFADATETAELITALYGEDDTQNQNNNQQRGQFRGRRGAPDPAPTTQLSERQVAANKVLAVADSRTNSVIVSAVDVVMEQIEQVVRQLDDDSSKNRAVRVYRVRHGDSENIAAMLQEMFQEGGSTINTTNSRRNTGTGTTGTGRRSNNQNSNTGIGGGR